MARERSSQLKPLLLSTTLRNPQRIKDFLKIILKYEGKLLSNEIIQLVVEDLIREKHYTPNYIFKKDSLKRVVKSKYNFSDEQVKEIILNSPQNHKEAGFDKGWPSRFETWFMLPKELGFLNYEMGKSIIVSDTGKKLIDSIDKENYLLEEKVFTNAFAKYQRVNPYSKVLNNNKPLILLLTTLKYLSENYLNEFKGISRQELAFIICWSNNDYKRLGEKILKVRKDFGFTPSDDYIYEECLKELGVGLENSNRFKKKNILGEMVDEFIRKMRLTGLITLRGYGRFVDINTLRSKDVGYIVKNYFELKVFSNNDEYFTYMSEIDSKFMAKDALTVPLNEKNKENKFMDWVKYFSFDVLIDELKILIKSNYSSKNEVLKYIKETVRLEFLTSLIIQKQYSDVKVIPNYISDDEGIPVAHAPGNNADILCKGSSYSVLFEVTLLTGAQQHIRESFSVARHLEKYSANNKNVFTILIAPSIFNDTKEYAEYFENKKNLGIIPISINDFVSQVKTKKSLEDFKYQ